MGEMSNDDRRPPWYFIERNPFLC